eukprot:TRINITY_DN22051_c0_g1_i1.p1 TRINITY_DN22051_c0_g1~~TRINITY_DN22051_c0_g1_i1.p1  ORF type:complete len:386 (+),score=94.82 TRINITY_DN22051_c0_g1_i1:179-1336(+)
MSVVKRKQITIQTKITSCIGTDGEADTSDSAVAKNSHPAQDLFTPGAVISVWGRGSTEDDKFKAYFVDRPINYDGSERFEDMPHSVGVVCQRGQKEGQVNQDDFFILQRAEWLLIGVCDGHGQHGHEVSHYVQECLPSILMDKVKGSGGNWDESAKEAFEAVNQKLQESAEMKKLAQNSGTTTSVAWLRLDLTSPDVTQRLNCAYIGDSAIVLAARKPGESTWDVALVGEVHHPDREDERKRIEEAGGTVSARDGNNPARLVSSEYALAVSRGFGDLDSRLCGLVSEPEVPPEFPLNDELEYVIIMASDGVWDMFSPEQAVQLVAKFPPAQAQTAAQRLASKAQTRWKQAESNSYTDDITVIVCWPGAASSKHAANGEGAKAAET